MKILIVGDTYHPHINGCSYFTQRLAYYLQEAGNTVAAVAPSMSFRNTDEVVNGVRMFGISSVPTFIYHGFRFAQPILIRAQMRKILRKFQPDIIHCQGHFTVSNAMMKEARKAGIPIVATNHFMPDNLTHYLPLPQKAILWVNEFMWRDFAKVFNKVPFVTTPTEIAANLIRPRLNHPVTAVTCGIDLEKFNAKNDGEYLRKRYGIPADKPVLLFVGRLDAEKRVDEVIKASAAAMKSVDFVLVVGGMGFEAGNLKKLAQKEGIADKVIFTGFVPDEDLPNLYPLADCFAIACMVELQCIVAMEAMATGLPVIAVRAGALPALVEDGVNGALFEPMDIPMLTQKIITIMSDKTLREKMGEESLRLIHTHGIQSMVTTYLSIYKQAIEAKKHE